MQCFLFVFLLYFTYLNREHIQSQSCGFAEKLERFRITLRDLQNSKMRECECDSSLGNNILKHGVIVFSKNCCKTSLIFSELSGLINFSPPDIIGKRVVLR